MSEHHPKNVSRILKYCNTCRKMTMHRVDHKREGSCTEHAASGMYLPNVFYLQPWQHGHGETKKTGFALHGLEPIPPTNVVEGREQRVWKMPPSETRKRDRSKTFDGVAAAIVSYWGGS